MPHHAAPPIEIGGFDHPHAFTNVPPAPRPAWGATRCPTCAGHGRRNARLFPDSFRCVVEGCGDCDGSGWLSADGTRHLPDVVVMRGVPTWTVRIVRPAVVVELVVPEPAEPMLEAA